MDIKPPIKKLDDFQKIGGQSQIKGEKMEFGNFDDFTFDNFNQPAQKKNEDLSSKFQDFKEVAQKKPVQPAPQPDHQNVDLLDLMDSNPVVQQNPQQNQEAVDLQFQRVFIDFPKSEFA